MRIAVDDLTGREIAEFLQAHLDQMRSITPPESVHALDLGALRVPEVTFWSATDSGRIVGCGALKIIDTGHAEIKSMRTAAAHQRQGVASQLLDHIICAAQAMQLTRLSLETGSSEFFAPARRLYEKFGFRPCGPFADYPEDPHSVHLTKELD